MADQDDVRRIALALPDTSEAEDRFAFSVANKGKEKGFVWAWNERVHPKKPRVPRADVLAVRVHDRVEKRALLASDPEESGALVESCHSQCIRVPEWFNP